MLDRKRFSNLFPYPILVTLIVFYVINNYIWCKSSSPVPIIGDEACLLIEMVKWYYPVENPQPLIEVMKRGASPPYFFSAVFSNRLFGISLTSTRMVNIFWLIIILISVYKLGKYLFNKETGLLASIILSLYPVVYGSSRLFREEFGLMAMVPLAILLLFKTQGFKNLKYSLLFGIFFGIGIMAEVPFILFTIGPLVYILTKSIIYEKERRKIILNFFITSIIIILIIFPRFLNGYRLEEYLSALFRERDREWYEFEALKVFTLGIANYQITLPFFLLFLLGFFLFLKRTKTEVKVAFLLWIIIPLIFLIFIPHRKTIRHIIPYLPAIALISAFGVASIKKKIFKRIIVFLIILVGLIQYYDLSFGIGPGLDKLKLNIFGREIPYFYNSYWDGNCACYRVFKDNVYYEVSTYVNEHCDKAMKTALLILPSEEHFYVETWQMFFWFKNFPFKITTITNYENFIPELVKAIKEADFVLSIEEECNLGLSRYIERQVEIIRRSFIKPFHREKQLFTDFEYFLKNSYESYKEQYLKEIGAFKIAKHFQDERGNWFYLFKRISK